MLPSLAHSPITPRPAVAGVEPMASTRPRDPPPRGGARPNPGAGPGRGRPPLQWALDVLIDSGLAAFLVLDGSRITYVSPAFLVLVGWKTSKAIRPANLPELISDPDCARFLAGLVTAGERHHDICALRRANDSAVYLAFDAAAIQTTTGLRTVLA